MAASKHTTLRYAITETELGLLLLAATDKGLQFVAVGDEKESLIENLKAFAGLNAQLNVDLSLSEWANQIVSGVKLGIRVDLPLDPIGTDFQKKVWNELCQIPVGQTITYSQLATRIGQPTAVRAVARACATNNLAIVIPCHRVIGSDGKLTGFRWGIQTKQKLLQWEGLELSNQLSLT